jgi:uncharacterized protein YcaQ
LPTLKQLRIHAISQSLFQPTTLSSAVEQLGFVQADPIRSPARAQDLILRHRVHGYREGQLENRYPDLEIEEDVLYAYGFVPRSVWHLLQPRATSQLGVLERKVLEAVRELGATHPRDLQTRLGKRRVVNAWGGYSAATTETLERLRHRGLLRIARRERGIRIYEAARSHDVSITREERLRRLILRVASILAPSPEKSLRAVVARYRRWGEPRKAVDELLRNGSLEKQIVDGVAYVWPVSAGTPAGEAAQRIRFLAPFDPLVWDRSRFEHFWGWSYRFEAYTPAPQRVRGYYAMPMLWNDRVIGWVNIAVDNGTIRVVPGFVGKRPADRSFHSEFECEVERFKAFLETTLT